MSTQGRGNRSNEVGFLTPREGVAAAPVARAAESDAVEAGAASSSADESGKAEDSPTATLAEAPEGIAEVGSFRSAGGEGLASFLVDSDEGSYPPVDIDNRFFSGDAQLHLSESPVEAEERDPRMALRETPELVRRRAKLQKYVKLALAAASALCVAALIKVAMTRSVSDEERRSSVDVAAAAPQPAENTVPLAAEPATGAPSSSGDTTVAAVPPAIAAVDPASPADQPSADSAASASERAEPDPKAAAKEKNDSRNSLERGKVDDSVEAGERSVALDSTDGEAWLILGAAYQQKGDMKNARRCYRACLQQGTRGPKYECAAMPH